MRDIEELYEVNKEDLPELYCDMDMVLVDFVGRAEELIGDKFTNVDKEKRWEAITSKKDFWHTLDWMPGAQRMWKLINKYNANILSAYSNRDANSRTGKKKWLSRFAKPTGRIHLVMRADKQKYATTNGKPNILIDDYIKNIKEWEAKGGIGIHHLSPTQTIAQLKRYGFR